MLFKKQFELCKVKKGETDHMLRRANIPAGLPPDITEILTTTFHELRSGKTAEGNALETLSTVMSTAEAVSVGFAAVMHAYYYDGGQVRAAHVVQSLSGSALKDSPEDAQKLRNYFHHVVKDRRGKAWQDYYEARNLLP